MKNSMLGGALMSLMLVAGAASAMDSQAVQESREALDKSYEESHAAMENRVKSLEATIEELKQQVEAKSNQ